MTRVNDETGKDLSAKQVTQVKKFDIEQMVIALAIFFVGIFFYNFFDWWWIKFWAILLSFLGASFFVLDCYFKIKGRGKISTKQ
jgi:hypothetical protein